MGTNSPINQLKKFIAANQSTWDKHPDLIFIKDPMFTYHYVNPSYIQHYPEAINLVNADDFAIETPESASKIRERDIQIVEHGVYVEEDIAHPIKADVYYRLTKSPIYNDQNDIIGIFGSARIISDHIMMKNNLLYSLNLIELLMDTIPYPIFVKDLDGVYVHMNKVYPQYLAIPRDQIIGKTDYDLFDRELADEFLYYDKKVIENAQPLTYLSNSTNGEKTLISKNVLYDDNNQIIGVVGIANPYASQDYMEKELLTQQKLHSVAELVSGMSHHLNNILTVITASSTMLLKDTTDDITRIQLQMMYDSSIRAAAIIDQFKTFSLQKSKKMESIVLHQFIDHLVPILPINPSTNIAVNQLHKDTPIYLVVDKSEFSQVLIHLVSNAIESMDGGEVTIRTYQVRLTPETYQKEEFILKPNVPKYGNFACIEIEDEGHGIDNFTISQIFNPYFTTKPQGTGLGLTVVFSLITNTEGLLSITTEIGSGTCFKILLPID